MSQGPAGFSGVPIGGTELNGGLLLIRLSEDKPVMSEETSGGMWLPSSRQNKSV